MSSYFRDLDSLLRQYYPSYRAWILGSCCGEELHILSFTPTRQLTLICHTCFQKQEIDPHRLKYLHARECRECRQVKPFEDFVDKTGQCLSTCRDCIWSSSQYFQQPR